jgi:hypothetical protein
MNPRGSGKQRAYVAIEDKETVRNTDSYWYRPLKHLCEQLETDYEQCAEVVSIIALCE